MIVMDCREFFVYLHVSFTLGTVPEFYVVFIFLQIMILYFIPYYSRYIHGEHVAVGGRAGAY